MDNLVSEEEKALLKRNEEILKEIKYYERIIDDFKNNKICKYDDASSSDSDDDLTILMNTVMPSLPQLKLDRSMLKTRLQATQELTSLQILQSETKIIDSPVLEGEMPVKEAGTWREVMAECKIDLVPFSITFYTHTPDRMFAPTWYRGVRVTVVKASHEAELSKSILPGVKKPSEAIAVLKRYSTASRSRRNTLAQLADLYESSLFMQPLDDGGFQLKCEHVLEMTWRLENKRSPFSQFHHRMKLDLEYMDEVYINALTEPYKQLSNPTISTDERTELLSEIISVCLKAKESLSTSALNDLQTKQRSDEREDEIMAPPKTVPRRSKSKAVRTSNEVMSRKNDPKTGGSSKRIVEDTDTLDQGSGQHNNNTEESAQNAGNRSKQIHRSNQDIGDSNKNSFGKRNGPAESTDPIENLADGNSKRKKINDKIPNQNAVVVDKEPSNIIKKSNVANTKNTQSTGKNQKHVTDGMSKTKKAETKTTGHKLVDNVTKAPNKDSEKKSAVTSNIKTPTDGIPVNKATKNINNAVKNNVKKQTHNFPKQSITNREQIISSSGDKIKKIDTPKRFNIKKPIYPLKIQNHRKSLTKRKSIGKKVNNNRKIEKENRQKISRIPQKLMSHSSGGSNDPKFKTSSNFNANTNTRKISSNIPRLVAKPGTSKK